MEDEVEETACEVEGCPSHRVHEEQGLWFCDNGHQQRERGQRHGSDEDDFGTQGKVNREAKEAKEKVYKAYRGLKAYRLYLQAYQLIIWKQCHALIHTKGLPRELEPLVRDLWTLRLQKLQSKFETQDEKVKVFSSQSEAENDAEATQDTKFRHSASNTPRLVDTICLCYIGGLLLRLPLCVGDLHRWIMNEEIPFLRAIRHVPLEMRERLPGEYFAALDTMAVPTASDIQKATADLAVAYQSGLGIVLPPVNATLLLFRYTKHLGVPPEVFQAVKRLASLLEFDFKWPVTKQRRYQTTTYPEAQIVSLVIIALKVCYPFDEVRRFPRKVVEPAGQSVDWSTWIRAQHLDSGKANNVFGTSSMFDIQESDVSGMTGEQMDDYMDWYEKTWMMVEQPKGRANDELLAMFPITRTVADTEVQPLIGHSRPSEKDEILAKVRETQSLLKARRTITYEEAARRDVDIPRPGMLYKHYRSEEELPATARAVYQAAANMAGMSLTNLVAAVFQTERKIQRWKERRERKERPDGNGVLEDSPSDGGVPDRKASSSDLVGQLDTED